MEATNKFEDGRNALEMVAITQRFMHTTCLENAETVRTQLLDEFGSILTHAFTPSNTLLHHPANYSTSVSTNSLSLGELAGTLVADLRSIAQRLSAIGHLEDCRQLYKTKRLAFLDASLRRFGIEKFSAVEVKRMEWEALDKAVGLWLTAIAFCVDLIPIEKQTHDSIFNDSHGYEMVMEIVRAYVSPFLDFTQAIATTHPSPQKLFRMLDLHHILKIALLPCVLLELPRDDPLVTQVEDVLSQLKEATEASFQKFEIAVNSDVTHISSVHEGGVHTTTNYVMDYMTRLISEYNDECEWIVLKPRRVEVRTRINGNLCEKKSTIDGSCGLSPFASHVIWVIAMLLRALKTKTKQLDEDDAFAHFFMMNNLNHIVQKLNQQPRLRQIIGGDFQCDLETDLRSRKLKYLRSSWMKILQDLEQSSSPKKIKLFNMALSRQCTRKETLRNFNQMLDKVHQTQSRWSASDANLVQKLRKVILDRLVPAYEHFLDQLSDNTEIQYSVEDVKKAISQLFQGRPPTSFQSRLFS